MFFTSLYSGTLCPSFCTYYTIVPAICQYLFENFFYFFKKYRSGAARTRTIPSPAQPKALRTKRRTRLERVGWLTLGNPSDRQTLFVFLYTLYHKSVVLSIMKIKIFEFIFFAMSQKQIASALYHIFNSLSIMK